METESSLAHIFDTGHKILRFPDRLASWRGGGIPIPISSELQITNRCTNACNFCMYRHNEIQMSTDFAKLCLEQLWDLGCLAVVFSGGGEPSMHPNLGELLRNAADFGLRVGFVTHGQRITEELASTIVSICDWARVSLSATTRESFMRIRNIDGFDLAVDGIRKLAEAARGSNCVVGVQWIYTGEDSEEDLSRFIKDVLVPINVDYVQILPEQTFDIERLKGQVVLKKIYERLVKEFGNLILGSKIEFLGMENFGRDYTVCNGSWFHPVISPDGNVHICCHYHDIDGLLGNLHEQSLREIWFSPMHEEVIYSVDVNQCLPLCKHHKLNRIFQVLKTEMVHEVFV